MFSLGVWSPRIQKGVCRLPTYSGTSYVFLGFHIRGYHALWPPIPRCSINLENTILEPYNPEQKFGLDCSLFARRLLRESLWFLFLRLLRYFSSARSPPWINSWIPTIADRGVSPFGHRRIIAFWELPDDFRTLGVLLRSNKPRHPPSALIYKVFIIKMSSLLSLLSNS